jgi:hypothetical protein
MPKNDYISVRVTKELRRALDQSAARSKRDIGPEIRARLDQSFTIDRALMELFGRRENRALTSLILKLAVDVEHITGKSWRDDPYTFEALCGGVQMLLGALPDVLRAGAPTGVPEVPDRVRQIYTGRPTALDDPRSLIGIPLALGLLDALRLYPSVAATDAATTGVQFSQSWLQISTIKADLGLIGGET